MADVAFVLVFSNHFRHWDWKRSMQFWLLLLWVKNIWKLCQSVLNWIFNTHLLCVNDKVSVCSDHLKKKGNTVFLFIIILDTLRKQTYFYTRKSCFDDNMKKPSVCLCWSFADLTRMHSITGVIRLILLACTVLLEL